MKKILIVLLLLLLSLFIGFVYGYLVHRNHYFPYHIMNKASMSNLYRKNMNWSIGIYEGASPFDLAASNKADNPVISKKDVNDIEAAFVADPFMIEHEGVYYMFFEVLNMNNYSGDIGYAASSDAIDWEYRKIILDEDFHLSYPAVYFWAGSYYMVPESSEDSSVRIYKARSFPEEWEFQGELLSGAPLTDPTIFEYHNKFWMFASNGNNILNLFYSDSLTSGWQAHPMNPLIENDPHIGRSAGHVFIYEDRLYRLAQDDYPYYGLKVLAVEITEISQTCYSENSAEPLALASMTGKGWNAAGMHQLDLHSLNGIWIGVVDGISRRP